MRDDTAARDPRLGRVEARRVVSQGRRMGRARGWQSICSVCCESFGKRFVRDGDALEPRADGRRRQRHWMRQRVVGCVSKCSRRGGLRIGNRLPRAVRMPQCGGGGEWRGRVGRGGVGKRGHLAMKCRARRSHRCARAREPTLPTRGQLLCSETRNNFHTWTVDETRVH